MGVSNFLGVLAKVWFPRSMLDWYITRHLHVWDTTWYLVNPGLLDPSARPQSPDRWPLHLHDRPEVRGDPPATHRRLEVEAQVSASRRQRMVRVSSLNHSSHLAASLSSCQRYSFPSVFLLFEVDVSVVNYRKELSCAICWYCYYWHLLRRD